MHAGAQHLSAPVWASKRAVAMASTSSMKMMAGAFSLARRNTSRTMRGPCIFTALFAILLMTKTAVRLMMHA